MLSEYLVQKTLVQNVSTISELEEKIKEGKPLNVMMGQTFDSGQPVDMMKYALFMMNLSDILREDGVQTNNTWLIADHFITEINQDQAVDGARKQVEHRINYLRKLNEAYRGSIGFALSSELSNTEAYKRNLEILFREADKNPKFKELVLNAVPPDRRGNPNALRYPFEELATIQTLNTDVKVGPPYEIFYDKPARKFAPVVGFNKYIAIQLTRSIPFGDPKIPAGIYDEIEKFGVLPYKIGSKGLAYYRIDPLNDSLEKIEELIGTTKNIQAIIDLFVIEEQAQQRLEGYKKSFFADLGFYLSKPLKQFEQESGEVPRFREISIELYQKFIHNPLRGENHDPDSR